LAAVDVVSEKASEETLLRPIMCSTNDLDHLERHMPSNWNWVG
jgi:hypothetical protein